LSSSAGLVQVFGPEAAVMVEVMEEAPAVITAVTEEATREELA
jgi:hypothetical protein